MIVALFTGIMPKTMKQLVTQETTSDTTNKCCFLYHEVSDSRNINDYNYLTVFILIL